MSNMLHKAGALAANKRLGCKLAYVGSALVGSALGAGAGMLSAPENRRLEGAMMGGAMGAAGGVGGKLLGKGYGNLQVHRANRELGKAITSNQDTVLKQLAAEKAIQAAKKNVGQHEVSGAALGAMLGGGAGVYQIAKQPAAMDEYEDPYGYSRMQPAYR